MVWAAATRRHEPPNLQYALVGRPRVNIQNKRGMAKAYQVRQVVKAIERLTESMRC